MASNSRFAVSVHILAYLAFRQGAKVSSAELAGSVATNAVVIRRLLAALTKARLVGATKGAAGGFALARPPAAVTLLEIHRAIEPKPDSGMGRFAPNRKCPVGAKIGEILGRVFARAQARQEAEWSRVTLAAVAGQLRPVCPRQRPPNPAKKKAPPRRGASGAELSGGAG
jgi:Rrf2 family protein